MIVEDVCRIPQLKSLLETEIFEMYSSNTLNEDLPHCNLGNATRVAMDARGKKRITVPRHSRMCRY